MDPKTETRVERVLEALFADCDRQEGRLTAAQVERIVVKRELSPAEVRIIFIAIKSAGIELEVDEDEEPEIPSVEPELKTSSSAGTYTSLFNRVGAYKLLTRKDEVELGRAISLARAAEMSEPVDSEDAAARADILERGRCARERLVTCNLRLALAWAFKYEASTALDLHDLFQEAVIGVMRAADRYNPELGFKFSTYAVCWINQRISRALMDKAPLVRIPVHRAEQVRKFRRILNALRRELNYEPDLADVAAEMEVPLEQVYFLSELAGYRDVSLSSPTTDDGQIELGDVLPSPAKSPHSEARHSELRERVDLLLSNLKGNQGEVLRRRFGIQEGGEETLQAIGDDFGVTRERIRQIEAKAMKMAKKRAERMKMKAFLR